MIVSETQQKRQTLIVAFMAGVLVAMTALSLMRTSHHPTNLHAVSTSTVRVTHAPPLPRRRLTRSSGLQYDPMNPKRIVIVQFDTRPLAGGSKPGEAPWTWLPSGLFYRVPYWTETAVLNFQYALRHGYDYLAFQLVTSDGKCRNANGDELYSSWCKVLAMQHALAMRPEAELFVYIDSDSHVYDTSMTVPHVLAGAAAINPRAKTATLLVSREDMTNCKAQPNTREALCLCNSGIQFWRNAPNSPLMRDMLQHWWSRGVAPEFTVYRTITGWPWEQGALSAALASPSEGKYHEHVAVIQDGYPESKDPPPLFNTPFGVFIRHYWSGNDGYPLRRERFGEAMKKAMLHREWMQTELRAHAKLFDDSCGCPLVATKLWDAQYALSTVTNWPDATIPNIDLDVFVVRVIQHVLPFVPMARIGTDPNVPAVEFTHTIPTAATN